MKPGKASLAAQTLNAVWSMSWRWLHGEVGSAAPTKEQLSAGIARLPGRSLLVGYDGCLGLDSDPHPDQDSTSTMPVPPRKGKGRAKPKAKRRACVYCGSPATTMDHLRPVIDKQGLPSGYLSDIWNRVPACPTCNCSKGNSTWEEFMSRTTGKAPLARGVHPTTHAWRVGRLRTFAKAGEDFLKRWHAQHYTEAIQRIRARLEASLKAHEQDMLHIQALVVAAGAHDNFGVDPPVAAAATPPNKTSKRPRKAQ